MNLMKVILERYVYPYDMFRSKPNVLDHNSNGFRGPELENFNSDKIFKIGFGGSTGYLEIHLYQN